MKIFISWSGERSKLVAEALKQFLGDVIQVLDIWMSIDIDAGSRWMDQLNPQLEQTDFGIICLTPENLHNDWILFEAGSLAKSVKDALVTCYLFNLFITDIALPLAQFQNVQVNEADTLTLLNSINGHIENPLEEDRLLRAFNHYWPDFHNTLISIPKPKKNIKTSRSERELLEEILMLVRPNYAGMKIQGADPLAFNGLNDKAIRILYLISQGLTNKEIASNVDLSEKTVRNYVSSILKKFDLRTRSEAAAYAIRHDIKSHLPVD